MAFVKHFELSKTKGLREKNNQDRDDFIKDKITVFSAYGNYSNKEKLLGLLQEIIDMIDYDETTATFDISDMQDIIFFDLEEHKKVMIAYYDIIVILGCIFLNVFNCTGNQLVRIEDGISGPISTSQMLAAAYNELEKCKKDSSIPYGANLVLASLLETDLKANVKIAYAKEWLATLQQQLDSGQVVLDVNDRNYYDYLIFQYDLAHIENIGIYDGVKATTSEFYRFLCKYNIISVNRDNEKFLNNEFTLNQFLNSTFCISKINPTYLNITKMLFSTGCLNIRNNLAHCNFGYINYHTSCVGALLYGLFSMISVGHIFIN